MFRVRAGSSGPPRPYLLPGLFSLSLSHFLSPPDRAKRSSLTPAPRPSFVDSFRKDLHNLVPHLLHTSPCLARALPRRNRPLHLRPPWKLRPELCSPSISLLRLPCLDSSRPELPRHLLHLLQPLAELLPSRIEGNRRLHRRPPLEHRRAPPPHVDPRLRPSSAQTDPKNRFPGEPSTFPALFPEASLPERRHMPHACRRPTQVRIIRPSTGSSDPTLFLCTKLTPEILRSGSSGLGSDHLAPSSGKKYCLAGSSDLWADHPTMGT